MTIENSEIARKTLKQYIDDWKYTISGLFIFNLRVSLNYLEVQKKIDAAKIHLKKISSNFAHYEILSSLYDSMITLKQLKSQISDKDFPSKVRNIKNAMVTLCQQLGGIGRGMNGADLDYAISNQEVYMTQNGIKRIRAKNLVKQNIDAEIHAISLLIEQQCGLYSDVKK